MAFDSLIFILYFLPLTLFMYYISNVRYKNLILLIASIFFYIWGSSKTVVIIFISIIINYFLGYLLHKLQKNRRAILYLGVSFNVIILIYYKYMNFFIGNFNRLIGSNHSLLKLMIPLGISYITFQQISYIVDIYRDKEAFENNFINYALYAIFFPKIIAGPITKYSLIKEDIKKREYNDELFKEGIYRFSLGLSKKVLISNTLALVSNKIFAIDPQLLGFNISFLGMITYTLQIYFDFSGYTDMAIGIAKMFSINLPENFDKPYKAKGFIDFWRRWHITLSSFLRDYIYIPLGGNRVSKKRLIFNTFILFLISGFWHGANFTFIAWGIYHGLFVIIEKLGAKKIHKVLPDFVSEVITFILVAIGWVFFRADGLRYSLKYLRNLLNPTNIVPLGTLDIGTYSKFWFVFILSLIMVFTPKLKENKILSMMSKPFSIIILIYSIAVITTGSFMPFIYLNF
ncbi:MBOAT family O-acyltransferase [Clostridium algidicarnis]|uniref:MBOAT family O-acyltransferase n=1 Tax=Clostridium algidicarnis TaxID=37659 RepID=UPI001C0C8DD0|nr:MBOAT family O-acyltransferase [Clostridium algidicarnis]MBU3193121.1 MBOAT family protein [Clostridium algidicarnis]